MRAATLDVPQHIDIMFHEAGRPDECVSTMAELIVRELGVTVPSIYDNSQAYLESQHHDADTWYQLYTMSSGIMGAALVSHGGDIARVESIAIRGRMYRGAIWAAS